MAQTIVTLSADDKQLLAALKRISGAQDNVDAGLKKIKKSSKEATSDFEKGLSNIATGLAGWAAGMASVQTAYSVVSSVVQEIIDRQNRVLDLNKEIAKSQQEAAKNLAGVNGDQISQILSQEVPKIALEAGFSDLSALTKALGSSASIVGDELAKSVVSTAARMERLTPENLQTTATSTADLVKATGVSDAREAMAMLLSAGSVARPEELGRLSLGAAKAVNAGTLASPNQNRVDAAKESAALFAMLTKVDKTGESAATATVSLISQLRTLFGPQEEQLAKLDNEIADINAKAAKGPLSDRDQAKLAAIQQQRDNLANRVDPGTTMGRLEALRNDPELRKQLLENLKGEEIFKPLFESLTNETSTESAELSNALKTVTTDVKVFNDAMNSFELTPQQRTANAMAQVDTAVGVSQFTDENAMQLAAVRQIGEKAMAESSTGMFTGAGNVLYNSFQNMLPASNAVGAANAQITELLKRRAAISDDTFDPNLSNKIQVVDTAIRSIEQMFQGREGFRGAAGSEWLEGSGFSVQALEAQTTEMKKQTEILERIAGGNAQGKPANANAANTPPVPTPNQIRAQAAQGATQ
jgi:hypothetical protein